MRTLVVLSMLLCAVSAFRLNEIRPLGRLNASPRSDCLGVPNGAQLPHPVNCNQFILCENNIGLTLTCRSSHPHFDRCSGRCVDDILVCMITDCNGAPNPPPTPTDPPIDPPVTQPPTTPEIPTVSTEGVTIEPEPTTTTRFVVPTVP
ncbi:unnamed protein product [Chironomus riparius]|uniref:Chitin-binding type-2 domain-containing protein n=1 Tax=Chironomus riparius TaxID=315576 RepID=A0A9P0J9S7_9DIPT|nr:unnamed protein product [Chironomus riparius]